MLDNHLVHYGWYTHLVHVSTWIDKVALVSSNIIHRYTDNILLEWSVFVHAQHADNAKHVYKGRTRRDKKYDVKNDVLKYCIRYYQQQQQQQRKKKKNVFHYSDLPCVQRVLIEHNPGRKIPRFRGWGGRARREPS